MKNHLRGKYPEHYSTLFVWTAMVILLFSSWRIIEHKRYEDTGDLIVDYYPSPSGETEQTYQFRPEPRKPEPVHRLQKTEVPDLIEKTTENIDAEPLFIPSDSLMSTTVTDPELIETSDPADDEGEDIILDWVKLEQMPVFPGCEKYKGNNAKLKLCFNKKIQKFILKNLDRDVIEESNGQGTVSVYISFIIDKNGKVTGIQTRSQNKSLAREAERVLSKLPVMEPGRQRLRKVRTQYILPLKFRMK